MNGARHDLPTTRTRRAVAGAAIATLATMAAVATADTAGATARSRPPVLSVSAIGTWGYRDHGDVVVNGTGELYLNASTRARTVEVAATIGPDDKTFPAPGDCEGAIATVSVLGRPDITLIGHGEVCGHWTQPPTSIVTLAFTGRYEVLEARRNRLVGTDGWFEVRLGDNGTAGVSAIDT